MSNNKILSVNPDFFSVNKRYSRKKRSTGESANKIKVRSASPKKKNDNTLKKKSILKMIRQHQEDRYKKLFDDGSKSTDSKTSPQHLVIEELDKGFNDAKVFLQNLAEKKDQEDKSKNYTLKRQPTIIENLSIPPVIQTNVSESIAFGVPPAIMRTSLPRPQYGCLKNGNLPTYRSFINKTRSNQPIISIGGNSDSKQNTAQEMTNISIPQMGGGNSTESIPRNHTNVAEQKINESLKRVTEMKQTANRLKELKKKIKSTPKRKKTVRRTYNVGKSKVLPRVSVLVSNKTIRNNTSTKSQLLKQVDISEVKKYLIKRGFIKIGSVSPNDVLRKMYEEAVLMCGEIQNHNPENLLYNFLNHEKL